MFEIEFETEAGGGARAHPWQNSWGMTTRTIGVMVMTHGDDRGVVLPPRVAQVQAVVIPIPNSKMAADDAAAMAARAEAVAADLRAAGVRVTVDGRENYTPGWKYAHWELKGVPLRVELGPRDMEGGTVLFARRDTGAKAPAPWAGVGAAAKELLDAIQAEMLVAARARFDACMETALDWEAFTAALDRRHMVLAPWADEEAVEEDVKKRSAGPGGAGAKTLCIPFEQPELPAGTRCFASGKPAVNWALWGRSY
jgi:prolyl-tRNA synthetase